MANINLEQLLLDLIGILDRRVRNPYDPCVDADAIKAALYKQGYKVSSKGELIGVDEEEPCTYLVYNKEKDCLEETLEKPVLADEDCLMKIAGADKYIRKSDWLAVKARQLAEVFKSVGL